MKPNALIARSIVFVGSFTLLTGCGSLLPRGGALADSGYRANTPSYAYPVPEHVGVQDVGQRYGCDRHAGPPAGANDLHVHTSPR